VYKCEACGEDNLDWNDYKNHFHFCGGNNLGEVVKQPFTIKFKKLVAEATVPTRATEGSAGFDLYVNSVEYEPDHDTIKVGSGVAVAIPTGYVGILSVRSSTYRYGLELANQIGIIDSDYRDEITIRLKYNGLNPPQVRSQLQQGVRIAQIVFVPCLTHSEEVEELPKTGRTGGYGSTGK
jgi:dUTP pyrophosphatase